MIKSSARWRPVRPSGQQRATPATPCGHCEPPPALCPLARLRAPRQGPGACPCSPSPAVELPVPRCPWHSPEGDHSQDPRPGTPGVPQVEGPGLGRPVHAPPALSWPRSLSSVLSWGCCRRARGVGRCGWRPPHLEKAVGVGPQAPRRPFSCSSVSRLQTRGLALLGASWGAGLCPTSREGALPSGPCALSAKPPATSKGESSLGGTPEGHQGRGGTGNHESASSLPLTTGHLWGAGPHHRAPTGRWPSPLGSYGALALTSGHLRGTDPSPAGTCGVLTLTSGHLQGAGPHLRAPAGC